MRAANLVWLLVAAAPLTGCGKRVEGCDYTGTCPVQDTSSSSGGTSAGGSTGTGGGSTDGGAGGSTTTSTTSVSGSTSQGGTGGSAGDGGSGGSGGDGGVGGASGASGAAGSPPCGGSCEGETPACDEESDTCVECVETRNCGEGVCDTEANHCVECLVDGDCDEPTPRCNDEEHACVECLGPADCSDPQASFCDAGSCTPCQDNGDCAHLTGTTVCDVPAGECVECTGTDYASCGANNDDEPLVCDSLTRACTEEVEHSAGLCKPCISDAHCALGELCVLQVFNEQEVGYFCFWQEGDTENGAPETCSSASRPYVEQVPNITSIDEQVANICDLDVSTCVARNQFRTKPCGTTEPDHSVCGIAPPADAVCAEFSATEQRCTMTCLSSDDCPLNSPCLEGLGVLYCEL